MAQNALIVERQDVLIAPQTQRDDSTTRLPVEDVILPSRFIGWSGLREFGRSKTLLNLFLCRVVLSMGEEPRFVSLESGAPPGGQYKKDDGERAMRFHA